jgi:hypothetical protein
VPALGSFHTSKERSNPPPLPGSLYGKELIMTTSKIERLQMAYYAKNNNPHIDIEEYPREDWKYDVVNGDTILGYWDWVIHNLES